MFFSTNYIWPLRPPAGPGALRVFQIMSNEVQRPRILVCPSDLQRRAATNFAKLARTNISYFVGLDADETDARAILAGDRNISTNGQIMSGRLTIRADSQVTWTADLHKHVGNLALADGSSQQSKGSDLSNAFEKSAAAGAKPMRFSIP